MSAYFTYFPNVYIGEGVSEDEAYKYRLVKNIFRRVKVRENLDQYVTGFEAYSISDIDTPSSLAYRLFRDSNGDWVILLVNNITDFYEQWPKNNNDLLKFVKKTSDENAIHHYETNEVKDGDIVITKKGIEVLDSFRTVMPDGTTKTAEQSRYPVSNYEHEVYQNELKRQILLPTNSLVDLMIDEFEDQIAYEPHPELDDVTQENPTVYCSEVC